MLREGKIPADNRVALTPAHCKWIHKTSTEVRVIAQASPERCYSDKEYLAAGVEVREDMTGCDILLGIKEVPAKTLLPGKTYLFFSHTKKQQPDNRQMFRAILEKKITLIDYECLEHDDGQRILGFGFFAGVVGAHNGIMAYGQRTGEYNLGRVHQQQSFRELIHTYFGLRLPEIKVAVTGSGRVAHGVLEVMNLLEIVEVEPDEFLERSFSYPVFTQLKGGGLYEHVQTKTYHREHFHAHPQDYRCTFLPFTRTADILMNGIYWDKNMPRLFEWEDMVHPDFRIKTIADITDDKEGSIPCNLGEASMEAPIYGVDRQTRQRTAPYLPGSVDVMAVGNLPNELPRDASRYFGQQLIKYVLEPLINGGSKIIDRATMVRGGQLMEHYRYLSEYAGVR
ncbi:alanine dehydrogenase [Puia dinghuensis]|uniref:Alanine dehydrogenase n=1 Tax=Puia dinghuensis TaxID=1792502 RepID=A0A8J2U8P2_9BACT|nr:alanine dehydrogenase [Puia dinghuensis]